MESLIQIPAPDDLARHAPDAHWNLMRSSKAIGRCSLWWQNVPAYPGEQLGVLGHYAAQDGEVAHRLLLHACEQLAMQGCTLAVGPMDGNTWRRYRLVTERGTEPPFFLEADNPDDWPGHFTAQGFLPFARYSSALNTDLTRTDPRLERVRKRMEDAGVQIRPIDVSRIEAELRRIYALSCVSFRHNFLYTPIEETEFLAQYQQILPFLRPELALLAEQEDELVGFLFALPDLLQTQRGQPSDTVIIKTVAVLPGRDYAGLGNLLAARCHAVAHALGYRRAIHALMHDSNNSRNVSGYYAQTMRRYTLFAKSLRP